MDENELVYVGDEVKALDDNGRVGGYLVRYGSPDDVDLTGDYFDAATDFDVDEWPHKSRVYYQHGMDERLRNRKLGKAEMRQDEIGVWVEAQLGLRDEYEKAIFELVKQGKMGWSSGTAGHLVEREQKGAAHQIKHWPLGLDASITPTPAEYRNSAMSLKSLALVDASYEALLPEDARPASVQSVKTEPAGATTISILENSQETSTMPEAISEVKASAIDQLDPKLLETITHHTIEAWKKAQKDEQEAKAVNHAFIQTPETDSIKAIELRQRRDELAALKQYIRDADSRAYQSWFADQLKASNATDMNITTAADGGNLVPVGHYQRIIAKRDETALDTKVGVLNIPGKGTTVNVPYESGTANVFISTAEAVAFDLDAPAVGQRVMTLVKYTKKIQLSVELIEDEDSQLMPFLEEYVGRALALTQNTALMTEVLANGTTVALTGSAAAAGHIPAMVYALPDEYADGAQWVMRRATEGQYRALSGNNWQFAPTPPGGTTDSTLWGFPVNHSQFVPAVAALAKAVVLANFNYVGKRQVNQLTFLRDPYSSGGTGQVNLLYYARFVYKVLQAAPVLYGTLA
jgi:HK97 family phage major capsid protein